MAIQFRELTRDEMEVRVHSVSEKGAVLLIYKDARADMRILDETVGPAFWQKRFYEHKGTLFCSVGIYIDASMGWVWKDDAGAPSNMEAVKGEASDAFKRSCTNWGIGRELYTSPFIWVPAQSINVRPGKNGKPQCFDRFRVEKVRIEDGRITGLSIWNETKACRCFVWQLERKA